MPLLRRGKSIYTLPILIPESFNPVGNFLSIELARTEIYILGKKQAVQAAMS